MLYLQKAKHLKLIVIALLAMLALYVILPSETSITAFMFFDGKTGAFVDAYPFGHYKVAYGIMAVTAVFIGVGYSIYAMLRSVNNYESYDPFEDTAIIKNYVYPPVISRDKLIAYVKNSEKYENHVRPTSVDYQEAYDMIDRGVARGRNASI